MAKIKPLQNYGCSCFVHRKIVEQDLLNKYVEKYKTEKGILLKRVLYGILAKK